MLQCGPQWTDNARGFTDSARAGTSEERHNLSARRAEEVSMANTCANPLMTGACLGQSKYSSSYRRFPPAWWFSAIISVWESASAQIGPLVLTRLNLVPPKKRYQQNARRQRYHEPKNNSLNRRHRRPRIHSDIRIFTRSACIVVPMWRQMIVPTNPLPFWRWRHWLNRGV